MVKKKKKKKPPKKNGGNLSEEYMEDFRSGTWRGLSHPQPNNRAHGMRGTIIGMKNIESSQILVSNGPKMGGV